MPTYISMICDNCSVEFQREKRQIKKDRPNKFCSKKCGFEFSKNTVTFLCKQCGKENSKKASDPQVFCNSSCFAYWNNQHQEHGFNFSKFELWTQEEIRRKFPELEVKFNEKTVIGSELDIYIPSLKLAFEVDGITHKEAIFGEEALKYVQENDAKKDQACKENGIELVRVDISDMKNIRDKLSFRIEGITDIIENRKKQTEEKIIGLFAAVHSSFALEPK